MRSSVILQNSQLSFSLTTRIALLFTIFFSVNHLIELFNSFNLSIFYNLFETLSMIKALAAVAILKFCGNQLCFFNYSHPPLDFNNFRQVYSLILASLISAFKEFNLFSLFVFLHSRCFILKSQHHSLKLNHFFQNYGHQLKT